MSATLGIIEIPCSDPSTERDAGSNALPLAGRRLGNKSLLEWVTRRVTDSLLLDQVIIVTDEGQAELVEKLAPTDVAVYVAKHQDALGRVAAAVRQYAEGDDTRVVRTTLRCPFIDPASVDRLVTTASGNPGFDYIGYFSVDGRPAVLSKVGFFADWCTAQALYKADKLAKRPSDRANSLHYLYSHPEQFQLRFIPVPEQLNRPDVRLTIESEDDWEHVQTIFDALGPESLDWRRIVSLLEQQPEMRERMASLNACAVV